MGSEVGILERADGESDGGKKKGGSCEADGEQAFVMIGGAASCSSLEQNGPEAAGGVDDVSGGGMAKDADDQDD